MKPAILVVDDDTAICEVLRDVLLCHSGNEALQITATQPSIALILLDMMLPDINGLLVLQQVQKLRPSLPVVMLTGMGSESDMVVGLEMGADDYIAKPFNARVVVARVKAVLRRSEVLAIESSSVKACGLQFNGWRLNTDRCQLMNPQQQQIDLTQGEYGLLLSLMQNARKVLSREKLLELTHRESLDVFDRTIDVLIMRLRRKIEVNPHQPTLIRTIRGVGYVFAADIIHA
ncbi:response regulator transcription factor [Yersinia pseudotuberculosis]|uniref:response regulator transcription factor n=1 Tax=Yersinia pseudotuberculosis TaxID=633 RepID=UPI00034D5E9E|nr:response regulator transcription factor [Yersinia pseudotuberculosis]QET00134.1 response regulator transcription factor [Yersinia pseudotuberculosis]CFU97631.1 putative response regulator protein [Yersinia pseudotuberculosis]CNC08204.1 putative response regulator protein [Yersinia pseudotuberculosis]CNC18487.1 putative response regulator protein [Yersinia pseudotuberculosis]CRY62179.1 putative response regulator protein [Yersinia pseudotuberculosis]